MPIPILNQKKLVKKMCRYGQNRIKCKNAWQTGNVNICDRLSNNRSITAVHQVPYWHGSFSITNIEYRRSWVGPSKKTWKSNWVKALKYMHSSKIQSIDLTSYHIAHQGKTSNPPLRNIGYYQIQVQINTNFIGMILNCKRIWLDLQDMSLSKLKWFHRPQPTTVLDKRDSCGYSWQHHDGRFVCIHWLMLFKTTNLFYKL